MKFGVASRLAPVLAIYLSFFGRMTAMAAESAAPTVGIEGQVLISLPGAPLKTIPLDPKAPMTVRIADALPRGTLTQYDLRYIGQVPGIYDLRKYLAREDGSAMSDVPTIEVRVAGLLPPNHSGHLASRGEPGFPAMGGYRRLLMVLGIAWVAILIPLWLSGRKTVMISEEDSTAPLTTADRLRPLIAQATSGKISDDEKAQLERLLLAHWRERLALHEVEPAVAMTQLRAHPEAGALLRTLEDWLHRPPGSATVDLDRFLAPYTQAAPAPSPERSPTPASA
jgi:hypothetical protein